MSSTAPFGTRTLVAVLFASLPVLAAAAPLPSEPAVNARAGDVELHYTVKGINLKVFGVPAIDESALFVAPGLWSDHIYIPQDQERLIPDAKVRDRGSDGDRHAEPHPSAAAQQPVLRHGNRRPAPRQLRDHPPGTGRSPATPRCSSHGRARSTPSFFPAASSRPFWTRAPRRVCSLTNSIRTASIQGASSRVRAGSTSSRASARFASRLNRTA